MRNKVLIENRLERVESTLKSINYCISRGEQKEGLELVRVLLEKLEEIRTFLSTETQE